MSTENLMPNLQCNLVRDSEEPHLPSIYARLELFPENGWRCVWVHPEGLASKDLKAVAKSLKNLNKVFLKETTP